MFEVEVEAGPEEDEAEAEAAAAAASTHRLKGKLHKRGVVDLTDLIFGPAGSWSVGGGCVLQRGAGSGGGAWGSSRWQDAGDIVVDDCAEESLAG